MAGPEIASALGVNQGALRCISLRLKCKVEYTRV